MTTTAKLLLSLTLLLGLFTASCSDNFSTPKDAGSPSGCIYAGVRHALGETFSFAGCSLCTCGFDGKVLCYCGDGGIIDARGDSTPDTTPPSDALMSDALGDATSDAISGDVSVSRDTNPVDAPASDLRLASERD